jgi:TetR/AcrR family transcriptional regulator, regulator of cefoperazone and chloramphenicol sensitivity
MTANGAARSGDRETRARLLRAAERLFAEHGFRHVTVREICRAAGANVAAVNYHFGDKLGLYREIVHAAIDGMRATNDAARRAGAGHPPEEQLRRFIITVNRKLLAASDGPLQRLFAHEMYDPTPALDDLVEGGLRPRFDHLSALVARVLGCDVADPRVLRCAASIQAQTIAYLPNAVATRIGTHSRLTASRIDEIAAHIAEFSLAGLESVRRAGAATVALEPASGKQR